LLSRSTNTTKRIFAGLRRLLSREGRRDRSADEPVHVQRTGTPESRWPPIYDFEELTLTIRDIVDGHALEKRIYEPRLDGSSFFQGDVIVLDAEVPSIGPAGSVEVQDAPPYWCVIGNTCDFAKPISDVAHTQIVPVWDLADAAQGSRKTVQALRQYKYYTQFYYPPWDPSLRDSTFVADLLRPVTIHKGALKSAQLAARLNRAGWILFHSCLVRFIARDDGRYD
jgi:hypothetical protein